MPRPRRLRRVHSEPDVTYFRPAGVRMVEPDENILTVDEYEAVRLKDFLSLGQEEASEKMNISQPTFHRLILLARKKIADAIVNGKGIRIDGGLYEIASPGLGMGRGPGGRGRRAGGAPCACVCPECGYNEPKSRRIPCAGIKCPECGTQMTRGD